MKICKNCGAVLEDDAMFCNGCRTKYDDSQAAESKFEEKTSFQAAPAPSKEPEVSLKDLAKEAGASLGGFAAAAGKTVGEKALNAKNSYEKAVEESSKSEVVLADGEVPIREYHVTKMFLFRVPGKLLITNKRIIFYSGSIGSRVVASTPIK